MDEPMSLADALAEVSREITEATGGAVPSLATPGQVFAERLAIGVFREPAFRAAEAQVLAALRSHPNAQSADGAATLPRAVRLWAGNLIFQEIGERISPAFLVTPDNTPHSWFGHDFPGTGISGDNPDNTYRVAYLDGAKRYRIDGALPPNRAEQLTFNLTRVLAGGGKTSATTVDLGNQITHRTDEALTIAPDGTFTITIGPEPGTGNQMTSEPGRIGIWPRDTRSDWRQPPMRLAIRCLDAQADRPAPTAAPIAEAIASQLPDFCDRWAAFRMGYLGRPPINTLNGPLGRNGEWGYLAGGRFELGPDEAIIAVTDPQGAAYASFHLTDPWAIVLDPRQTISARNNSQTVLGPDGSATFVISARDPGVPNWICTSGLSEGEVRLRWQKVPAGFDTTRAIRRYEKVAFDRLTRELPDLVGRVSATERASDLARRAADYDIRWTE